jgi:hypothetical protein
MIDDLSWRLRVTSGAGFGGGFAVTGTRALTCAHVLGRGRECEVTPLGGGAPSPRAADPVPAWPGDPRADVAVVGIDGHTGAVAPLGPITRPAAGAVVTVLGMPHPREERRLGLAAGDLVGRQVRAVVAGPDASGAWLQIDPADAGRAWVEGGFSGSAAVDVTSGRVAGMVVAADPLTAWLVPMDTLAGWVPWLGRLAGDPLRADPGFVRFHDLLEAGRYPEAMDALRAIEPRFRGCSDTYFYWALTMLDGHRPAHHSAPTVEAVLKVLDGAIRLDPRAAHPRALRALVQEDAYRFSARNSGRPDLTALIGTAPDRAAEILQHVPARECRAWQSLLRTADRPGV